MEVEQLALCPGSWPEAALRLFGLEMQISTQLAAAVCTEAWRGPPLPLLACLGLPPSTTQEDSSGTSCYERCAPDKLVRNVHGGQLLYAKLFIIHLIGSLWLRLGSCCDVLSAPSAVVCVHRVTRNVMQGA